MKPTLELRGVLDLELRKVCRFFEIFMNDRITFVIRLDIFSRDVKLEQQSVRI